MDLQKVEWGGMDWIALTKDREFTGICNAVMYLSVSQYVGICWLAKHVGFVRPHCLGFDS
jgi:hypothetical protein